MTEPQTQLRHADLGDLVEMLREQRTRKIDMVVPATALRAVHGNLVVTGAEKQAELTMGDDGLPGGVTEILTDGIYRPTQVFDEGICDRLEMPPGYLAKCRRRNLATWDDNVNGWLTHGDYAGKHFLLRAFRGEDGGPGIGRAFLSDSYDPSADDLDILMAALEGVRAAGVAIDVAGCNLTDRRMYVHIRCEQIAVNAGTLVENYRSPFTGQTGKELPMVFAGLEISNSEVGLGRFTINPRIEFQVCKNGQTRAVDGFARQHLGKKLTPGMVKWSAETESTNLKLIQLKTADTVRALLSEDYLRKVVAELTAKAGIEVTQAPETIKYVVKQMRYTDAMQDAILAMFVKGGDLTAGGVMHAVTAVAQASSDADLAADLEADAEKALSHAAAYAAAHN